MKKEDLTLETIVTLAKHRGFVFPGSEIYGGLANSWDYGPLGVLLKNNIRDAWWKFFVQERDDIVGLDAAILMNPKVWEASGHVANFNDPLVDCKSCKSRWRADHLLEAVVKDVDVTKMSLTDMSDALREYGVKCPQCGEKNFTNVRTFNLLFETSLGTVEGEKQAVYLRGELAQAMFVDFKRIYETMRQKLPFGIAQIGRVFRNEITPGQFTYRTLEFDLMEFEYFIHESEWERLFAYWLEEMQRWLESIGFSGNSLRVREHAPEELSHYSKKTVDIEYKTPFGWKELCGFAYRTDYDLRNHSQKSGEDLTILDPETGKKFFPHVLEPTFGLTRHALFMMFEAYDEEEVKGEKRVVLRFPKHLAPYQVAVLPLSKKDELSKIAHPLALELKKQWSCDYDETQSIGKRYRRQDEIGTPYCVTVDFDSLEDKAVTVRDRDSMEQERIPQDKLRDYLNEQLSK
jgi:glycyl-tRNA synthetase